MRFIFRSLLSYAVVAVILLVAFSRADAQSLPNVRVAPAARQITGPIDESNLQRLTGNPSPSARTAKDQGRVPNDFAQEHILMMLKRGTVQQRALDQFMREQYDRRSANFHQWITGEQQGELYGLAQQDLDTITSWLIVSRAADTLLYSGEPVVSVYPQFAAGSLLPQVTVRQYVAAVAKWPSAVAVVSGGMYATSNFS